MEDEQWNIIVIINMWMYLNCTPPITTSLLLGWGGGGGDAHWLVPECRCFSGGVEWLVVFFSLGLLFLHGLIKVRAARPVFYNPDVLLIMSSCATPKKKLPFRCFTQKTKCPEFATEPGPGVTACFILFPVTASRASKYNSSIVFCCYKWFWHNRYGSTRVQ